MKMNADGILFTINCPAHTHTYSISHTCTSHTHMHPSHVIAECEATIQCVFSVGGVCIAVAPVDNTRNVIVPYYSTLFDNSLYEYGFLHPCRVFSFYKGVLPPLLSEIPKRATKV